MHVGEMFGKWQRIRWLWFIHSFFPRTKTSSEIHQIYNELSEYGEWDGDDFYLKKERSEE